ncbi:N-acetyltransferase [Marinicauda algicola]|uniref:N-acetyltransferase n=1 Tax=Marinicauda algicola TaxID=2029849 RepID=A0A4S2H3D2_9PROT|nr:GNAT family N-acetyltransferase [Marinicauda algicola]TGY90117.1 N-acetyltransferase [Marinicauda algicola]
MNLAPRLETERLILRLHRAEDFEASAAMWANPDVVRHIGGQPSPRGEAWMRMLRYPGLWALLGYGYLAIEDKATGRFAGEAGLADFKREMSPSIEAIPEAGWALHPDFHGRGLATEAVGAVLGWADANLDARETCCIIDPGNTASVRVAQKLGFTGPQMARFRGSETLLFRRARRT